MHEFGVAGFLSHGKEVTNVFKNKGHALGVPLVFYSTKYCYALAVAARALGCSFLD